LAQFEEVDAIVGKTEVRINERIRAPMVRVIGPDGTQLGVLAVSDALRMARELELDLVEVAPTSRPPVCRVMDFGKYRYEQAKREQKAKRRQHLSVVKEVKLRPKIEDHDFDFKVRNARKFLEERDKVKITVLFRGREISHPELGYELIRSVAEALLDVATVEQQPTQEGRMLVMMLAPKPGVGAAKPKREDGPSPSGPAPGPAAAGKE
jgi:translation initiation factor IF-3